ncbi:unnamed protein product [Effrenium voratum]|nr:unnamed protein product [Effrenium voratum]
MQDAGGDIVEVAVYNVPGAGWEATERLFYKGRTLAIDEPYYKQRMDGSLGIRVDDPAEITDATAPSTADDFKARGNQCFQSGEHQKALDFYLKAMQAEDAACQDLSVLCSNKSLCQLRLEDLSAAACWAGLALHLDPQNAKAKHRLSASAEGLSGEPQMWPRLEGVVRWRPLHNDAAEDWAELKQQGKSAFESGEFAEANNLYDLAIRKHPQLAKVAALLCNSSAALLELQRFVEALSSASVAALLATEEALASKAWIRRGRALEGLKDKLAMKALDSVPLRLVQAEAGLLRKRFLAAQVAPVSELTTAEQLKRRDGFMNELKAKEQFATPDELCKLTDRFKLAPKDVKKKLLAEFGPLMAREVPAFHEQYPKRFGYPGTSQEYVALCRSLLHDAYAHATTSPWMMEISLKSGHKWSDADLMKRYHGTAGMAWVAENAKNLRPGAIMRFREGGIDRYSEYIRTSFCNHTTRKDILHFGTTHVAVGFNDLGMLLTCQLLPAPQGPGPLRFVGIDCSAYSVAKSLVIGSYCGRKCPWSIACRSGTHPPAAARQRRTWRPRPRTSCQRSATRT